MYFSCLVWILSLAAQIQMCFCYQLLLQFWLGDLYCLTSFQMHLASSVSNTRLQDLSRASLLSKCHSLGKKKIEYLFNCFIQGYDESLLYQGPEIFHSGKNSAALSKWLPINKPTLWLSGLFRNPDFISCLGRRITIQPQPQSCHLPLDYSLVLSAIRAEWVNNEKRLTLLFISSSIVLLVLTDVHQYDRFDRQ